MSDHNENKKHESPETRDEEVLAFVPGSSVIDIGELRKAQASMEADLDEEARLLREEIENDPEMKVDVLAEFDSEESNENLDRIAQAVETQEIEQLREMEVLSKETSEELKALNEVFIAEDRLLEAKIAEEASQSDSEEEDQNEEMSEEDAALKAALPKADADGNFDLDDLQSCIDTLLFYSDRPLSLKRMKEMLELSEASDEPLLEAIALLKESYQTSSRGFEIAEIAGGYQFRTKVSKAPLLRKLAKVQIQRLSRGAMETLTIVSYKQPCTKDDIDQVRGVDSSHFIRTLLDRKLIEVSGRSEAAGRPMIYSTTDTFLEVFGLMDLKGLPPLREIEAMVPQMAAAEEGAEDPRVLQMRKMVNQMKTESNHLDYDAREDERILQEIRERVKSIDITTPYLARQKELADQGIVGEEAEAILMAEFNLRDATSGGEVISTESNGMDIETLSEAELAEIAQLRSSNSEENLSEES
jgi:segregation and condensation protein B